MRREEWRRQDRAGEGDHKGEGTGTTAAHGTGTRSRYVPRRKHTWGVRRLDIAPIDIVGRWANAWVGGTCGVVGRPVIELIDNRHGQKKGQT